MTEVPLANASEETRATARLSPMQVPKASDVLADELRERILKGDFPEGTPLPPERDLVAQTHMSRTTVREALRILEVQGFVQIRTGRSGGAFIQRPGRDSIATTVTLLIRGRNVRLAALLETRGAVEPASARLAAKYRTSADLEALDAANEAIAAEGSLSDFLKANIDWHVAVAVASHNELLTGFMSALSKAIYVSTDNQGFVDAGVRATTVSAHANVTRAIREGDADAAVRRMARHVHEYAEAVLAVEERTEIDVPDDAGEH